MPQLGRLQPALTIIIRTPAGSASGDVAGAATASATVVGQGFGPAARPVVVTDPGVLQRIRSAYRPVTVVETLPGLASGDVAGAATASATVVGQGFGPAVQPIVVADPGVLLQRQRLAYDPVTIIVPPIASTPTAGDVSGTATASATVVGQSIDPVSVARPVVVSDPGVLPRLALAYDPVIVIVPPVPVTPTAGDVTGAATASATVVGASQDPPRPVQVVVVPAVDAAFRARTVLDPVTLFAGQVDPPASGSGDVTGAATASATVVGQSVDPLLTEAPIVVSPGQAAAFRARVNYDPVIIIAPRVQAAPGAGDVNGVATAAATVVGLSVDPPRLLPLIVSDLPRAFRARLTLKPTTIVIGSGLPAANGDVAAAVTAAATVVGARADAGAVLAAVTASATVVGAESGGVFALIGGITGGTAATSSLGAGTSTTSGVAATTSAASSVSGGTSHT